MRQRTLGLLLFFLLVSSCSWIPSLGSESQTEGSPAWLNSLKHSHRYRKVVSHLKREDQRPTLEVVLDPEDTGNYPTQKVTAKIERIHADILKLNGVRIVSVKNRDILSRERLYSLQHASLKTITPAGHVRGANLVLIYSPGRGTLQLLVLETNEILWTKNVKSLSISPDRLAPPPSPPPPPWSPALFSEEGSFSLSSPLHNNTWTGLQIGAGLGGAAISSSLSGYGVTQPLPGQGAFAWEGLASIDMEWSSGFVTGVEVSASGIGSVTQTFNIPTISTHSYGENLAGASLQLGYDLSAFMPYLLGGAGIISGTGEASGLSSSGPRMGAGVDIAITPHVLLYTEWDLQMGSWTTPGTSGAINVSALRSFPPGTTLTNTINVVTMGVLYSFWGIGN